MDVPEIMRLRVVRRLRRNVLLSIPILEIRIPAALRQSHCVQTRIASTKSVRALNRFLFKYNLMYTLCAITEVIYVLLLVSFTFDVGFARSLAGTRVALGLMRWQIGSRFAEHPRYLALRRIEALKWQAQTCDDDGRQRTWSMARGGGLACFSNHDRCVRK